MVRVAKNARQFALVLRIEMEDDNESRVDFVGQALEEHLQRPDAAGRGSDADRRERIGRRFAVVRRRNGRLIAADHITSYGDIPGDLGFLTSSGSTR